MPPNIPSLNQVERRRDRAGAPGIPADRRMGLKWSLMLKLSRLTRGEMMHLALMSSENRAAHALGRGYPGGLPAFVQAMNGRFEVAAVAIFIAMVFDVLDGKSARLTNSTSHFGLEYDSLSDVVSFGVAPALLAYFWALVPLRRMADIAAKAVDPVVLVGGAVAVVVRGHRRQDMLPGGHIRPNQLERWHRRHAQPLQQRRAFRPDPLHELDWKIPDVTSRRSRR